MSNVLILPSSLPAPRVRGRLMLPGRLAATVVCLAIFAVAVWLRLWKLGTLPGINGDEAWSGVQALRFLAGDKVAWRTPTGNPLNVFHFGPLVILHAWLPPSFALLRSVAAASGLAALVVNFWLCRKSFDPLTAITSTLLLAALPINVAYCRFAWDASQTLLATVLVMHASLIAARNRAVRRRATCWAIGLLGIAVWVHPTNVFIGPLVGVCLLCAWRAELVRLWTRCTAQGKQAALLSAAFVLGMSLAWLLAPWLQIAAARLLRPADYLLFVRDLGRMFSGTTVYRFISGSYASEALDVSDAITACLFAVAAFGMYRRWTDTRDAVDGCLIVGWPLSLLGFFLIAGPTAIAPHFERYAIWLIAPTALLAARGAGWWLKRASHVGTFARCVLAVVCVTLLASCYGNYFRYIEQSGGNAHRTFRTADVEPKAEALAYILAHSDPAKLTQVVTDEWWSYWPLAYLAHRTLNADVVMDDATTSTGETPVAPKTECSTADAAVTPRWRVVFADTSRVNDPPVASNRTWSATLVHTCNDYAGRPVLEIFSQAEKVSRNN